MVGRGPERKEPLDLLRFPLDVLGKVSHAIIWKTFSSDQEGVEGATGSDIVCPFPSIRPC